MKTKTPSLRIARRIFTIMIAGLLTTQFSFAQWLSGWQYRVPISITNSGGALSDFQVQVSLGVTFAWGHTQAGGTDVRFTSDDGETAIDFWIENWNTTGYQRLNSSNFTSITCPDYVTELDGLQITGTNWGLCTRVTAFNNFYGSIVYDHLNMLYFYDWLPGGHPSQSTSIGTITTNVWYKLTVRVFGTTLQVSFDDVPRQNIQNSNHPLGNIALWEQDGTAYFNDVRVRKHALVEPAAVIGPEESPSPLSITYSKADL